MPKTTGALGLSQFLAATKFARHVATRHRVYLTINPTQLNFTTHTSCNSSDIVQQISIKASIMGDKAPSLKRPHTQDRAVSPPPVKRRQTSTTTRETGVTRLMPGSKLTCLSQSSC